MLLEGHLRFKETLKKKKTNTDKQQVDNMPNDKIGSRGLVLFSSLVQNVKWKYYCIRKFLYLPVT